jgi:hypothetical protein
MRISVRRAKCGDAAKTKLHSKLHDADFTRAVRRAECGDAANAKLHSKLHDPDFTRAVRRAECGDAAQRETTQQTTRSGETTQQTTRSGFHACSPESGVRRRCATCVYHRVFHNTFRTHTYRHLATPLFLKRRPVFSTLSQGKRQKLASDRKSQTVALWVRKVFGVSSRSREDLTKHLPPACRCS